MLFYSILCQSRAMLLGSAASYVHEGKVMLNELVEVER